MSLSQLRLCRPNRLANHTLRARRAASLPLFFRHQPSALHPMALFVVACGRLTAARGSLNLNTAPPHSDRAATAVFGCVEVLTTHVSPTAPTHPLADESISDCYIPGLYVQVGLLRPPSKNTLHVLIQQAAVVPDDRHHFDKLRGRHIGHCLWQDLHAMRKLQDQTRQLP